MPRLRDLISQGVSVTLPHGDLWHVVRDRVTGRRRGVLVPLVRGLAWSIQGPSKTALRLSLASSTAPGSVRGRAFGGLERFAARHAAGSRARPLEKGSARMREATGSSLPLVCISLPRKTRHESLARLAKKGPGTFGMQPIRNVRIGIPCEMPRGGSDGHRGSGTPRASVVGRGSGSTMRGVQFSGRCFSAAGAVAYKFSGPVDGPSARPDSGTWRQTISQPLRDRLRNRRKGRLWDRRGPVSGNVSGLSTRPLKGPSLGTSRDRRGTVRGHLRDRRWDRRRPRLQDRRWRLQDWRWRLQDCLRASASTYLWPCLGPWSGSIRSRSRAYKRPCQKAGPLQGAARQLARQKGLASDRAEALTVKEALQDPVGLWACQIPGQGWSCTSLYEPISQTASREPVWDAP